MRAHRSAVLTAALLAAGCGAAGPGETGASAGAETAVVEEPSPEAAEPVQVDGLLGNISQHDVERTVQGKMNALAECYGEALDALDVIEGEIVLAMTVDLDGSVAEAYLRDGNLGSLAAERCMLGVVERLRFPKPGGGRAEVSYPLVLDAPYDPPEPIAWGPGRTGAAIEEHMDDLERCLGGRTGVRLTLYVGPGGGVVSSGATAGSSEMYDAAECLAEAAAAWAFPDPGPDPAKAVIDF